VEQNTGGAVAPFVAGKNKIINGDFGIWQRGTSFTSIGNSVYTADRWCTESNGTSIVTQQTFTGGSAPVAGYAGQYFLRQQVTSPSTVSGLNYRIEDIRTLSGQTATISFWAKAASTTTLTFLATQFFVSAQQDNMNTTFSIGTSWQRYTFTGTIGSIAGYTLPNPNFLSLRFLVLTNTAYTLDIWGVQLEAGSVATPFTTATGTFQGELAACQRYYYRITAGAAYGVVSTQGVAYSTTSARIFLPLKSTMRSVPLIVEYANLIFNDGANLVALGTLVSDAANGDSGCIIATTTSLTAFRPYAVTGNNNAAGYLALSAEL
jgi:hypothetical protein